MFRGDEEINQEDLDTEWMDIFDQFKFKEHLRGGPVSPVKAHLKKRIGGITQDSVDFLGSTLKREVHLGHSTKGRNTSDGGFTHLRPRVGTWASPYLWRCAGRGGAES